MFSANTLILGMHAQKHKPQPWGPQKARSSPQKQNATTARPTNSAASRRERLVRSAQTDAARRSSQQPEERKCRRALSPSGLIDKHCPCQRGTRDLTSQPQAGREHSDRLQPEGLRTARLVRPAGHEEKDAIHAQEALGRQSPGTEGRRWGRAAAGEGVSAEQGRGRSSKD